MRIGILGGTFDPPHNGHLALARAAMETLELEEVMFLPAFRNPLKRTRSASAKDRLEMTKLAVKGEPKTSVSDIEIVREGPSYAIETMQMLTYVQPAEYWFLVGTDALRDFERWKQPERLLKLCRLGVVDRAKQDHEHVVMQLPAYLPEAIDWIDMPPLAISSTELRVRIADGKAVAQWIPPAVMQYIEKNKLYRSA